MEIPEKELEIGLLDAGNKLLSPPSAVSELLEYLNLVENLLAAVEQSPSQLIRDALVPTTKALIAEELCTVALCRIFLTIMSLIGRDYSDSDVLSTLRDGHHDTVLSLMETIMTLVLEESEDISVDLVSTILSVLKKDDKEVLPIASQLGEKVVVECAHIIKPYLLPAVRASGASLEDYRKAVADVFQAGDEAVDPTDGGAANKNSADENLLINAPSEKAVEVAMETMEDAPMSEEAGPSMFKFPKTASNSILKEGNEDTLVNNDNSKEADHVTQDEKADPSKTIVDSAVDEKPPKSKTKRQKTNRRKGRKPNSTKPFEPLLSNRKMEVIDTHEHQENDDKDIDDIQSEDADVGTSKAAHNEKPSEVPVPSPKTSDNTHVDISSSSPIGSLIDETCSKKIGRGNKKEHPIEEESVCDFDSKKESVSKQDSEGHTVLASASNKRASKKSSSASIKENSLPASTNDTKKEDDNINELDGVSAKDLVQVAEDGGNQRVNNRKQVQMKATPVKGHTKPVAKEDKKKTVALPKSTPKAKKDERGMEEAPKSSSKRKRPNEEKAPRTELDGPHLVGSKIEVWWPDDKAFYEGVVKSFDAADKEHKVFYEDGDVEVLNLKNETWKLVDDAEGLASDDGSPDESADEIPIGKKAKASADPGAKQGKTLSSTKTPGALFSKSKATPKSGSNLKDSGKIAGKSKQESSKKVNKPDLDKSGKSEASKSGNKSTDDTPEPAKKSKDEDDDTLKDTAKAASKSKGKAQKSVGKSNPNTSGQAKVATLTLDEETDDELLKPEKTAEKSQGESQKNSNKRKRSVKG